MTDRLVKALANWDGKKTGSVKQIYWDWSEHPSFIDTLISSCSSLETQVAATWLIKHHEEQQGLHLNADQLDTLIAALPNLQAWAAQLHLLQILENLPVSGKHRPALMEFVERCASSKLTLARAWGYFGYAILGTRFPGIKDEALSVLTRARENETAGSIKVRLRKAIEKLSQ